MNVKRGSTTFLKVIIFLAGVAVLALCIYWLPEIAIKDAKVHPDTAYFLIPFLVCAYGFCITFSFTLFHVYKLLTFIERNNAFSESSLKSLKVIKKCAFTVIFLILLGIVSLKVLAKITGDDPAGPISLSLMGVLATSIIAAIVDALQKPLINVPDIKSKND
jgi:heme/copper-type cytochrome/quinol oxidase subunit 1